jgi:cystathionine beta-lyase/cystathionine gamma-synthase
LSYARRRDSTALAPARRPTSRLRARSGSCARQLSDEELVKAGIRPATIRLSIGIEHIDHIIDDIDQALAKATVG